MPAAASPPSPYIIEEYVRWSDVDFAGIIFYGSYVRFFEIAETEMFRACGLAYKDVFARYGIFLPRKAVYNEFFHPPRLDDRLRVATYVGMLELIKSNMGDLPLVHKIIIGFSVAMLILRGTML